MKKLIFATQNLHKLEEIRFAVGNSFSILSLRELNFFDEIPETGDTLIENANQKANFIYEKFKIDCFADDTGLEIDSLGGEPGVYSARYAGEGKSFTDNMNKVLEKLQNHSNRKARFKTVISLILNGKQHLFEGSVEGVIIENKKGVEGFGYDPIFKPDGYLQTFAEMSLDEKNKISHRANATKKLVEFLRNQECI